MKAHWNHKEAPHCIPDKHPAFHHSHGLRLSKLKVSSCQQPWPGSLAHCCFGKHIFKTPWFWDQPGNVLARGGSIQKAVWNYAPLCHVQRSYNGNTVISSQRTPSFPHRLQAHSLLLRRDGSSFGAPPCGVVTRELGELPGLLLLWGNLWGREGGTTFWARGIFFSYLSVEYLSMLLSASLYWSKTVLFLYLNVLYLPKLTESLQWSHSPPYNERQ